MGFIQQAGNWWYCQNAPCALNLSGPSKYKKNLPRLLPCGRFNLFCSGCSTALEQANDNHNHCQNQQNMDYPAQCITCDQAKKPKDEEYHSDG